MGSFSQKGLINVQRGLRLPIYDPVAITISPFTTDFAHKMQALKIEV